MDQYSTSKILSISENQLSANIVEVRVFENKARQYLVLYPDSKKSR